MGKKTITTRRRFTIRKSDSKSRRKSQSGIQCFSSSNLEDLPTYTLSKTQPQSGNAVIESGRIVKFPWPKVSITLWPHKMVTVPLGWSTKQAPSDTIVVLSGTQGLLSRGVFCPSVTVHQSRFGAEITVPLVNFTNYPIQIENGVLEKKAFRLGPNGKQQLFFDWGEFMTAILYQAVAVLPYLI